MKGCKFGQIWTIFFFQNEDEDFFVQKTLQCTCKITSLHDFVYSMKCFSGDPWAFALKKGLIAYM